MTEEVGRMVDEIVRMILVASMQQKSAFDVGIETFANCNIPFNTSVCVVPNHTTTVTWWITEQTPWGFAI